MQLQEKCIRNQWLKNTIKKDKIVETAENMLKPIPKTKPKNQVKFSE